MVAEDDVDMESLQAQIDMSMSFAQNLVTSWIKPTHLAQLRPNGVNAAQILEEESRRPPRLGVGASIPAAPLAHEASKLKRRLGKNGTKNGDVVQSPPQDSSKSDNEEHKGRPVKQKTKVDPFRHEGSKKKKRKANSEANRFPSAENSTLGEPPKHKKKRMGPDDQQSATLMSSPSLRSPVQTTFSSSPTAPKPSRETYVPVSGKTTTSGFSRVHTNSMPLPDKVDPFGVPLLNLDGPPELTDQPGNTSHLNIFRRKQKRRKKKKVFKLLAVQETTRIEHEVL